MEITIESENFGIALEVIKSATSRVDETDYKVDENNNVVLVAMTEDSVWNVWREINKMAETSKSEEAEEVANAMADYLENTMRS